MIDANARARASLVRGIIRFAEHLHKRTQKLEHKLYDDGSSFHVGQYDCRSESLHRFDRDGNVWHDTWDTSHHNGDPYNERSEKLSDDQATTFLSNLYQRLTDAAVDHEIELLRKNSEDQLRATALRTSKPSCVDHRTPVGYVDPGSDRRC